MDKDTHDDYIRLYKELVDREDQKERIIEDMTKYIAKYAKKVRDICALKTAGECNYKNCKKCVRDYFEKRNK